MLLRSLNFGRFWVLPLTLWLVPPYWSKKEPKIFWRIIHLGRNGSKIQNYLNEKSSKTVILNQRLRIWQAPYFWKKANHLKETGSWYAYAFALWNNQYLKLFGYYKMLPIHLIVKFKSWLVYFHSLTLFRSPNECIHYIIFISCKKSRGTGST